MKGGFAPGGVSDVTNSIAIALLVMIAGFLLLDAYVLHQGLALQLARSFVQFVEWLSFWR